MILVGYTALTLAMMAQFGRDTWRSNAEVFTVWFRLLGRLAPYALVDEAGHVRRRSFATGLLEPGWTMADVVMTALAVGSILFDGLSQTLIWFETFGVTQLPLQTILLARLPRPDRGGGRGGHAVGGDRGDRGRPATDRRSVTSSPTT